MLALRPKHKRFEGFGRRLLGSSWGRGAIIIMKIIKVFCFPKMIFL